MSDNNVLKVDNNSNKSLLDLTPAIEFQISKSHEENGVTVIDEINLWCISLNTGPNADPSIKSIREQLKNG